MAQTVSSTVTITDPCDVTATPVTPVPFKVTPATCKADGRLDIPAQPAGVGVEVLHYNPFDVDPPWFTGPGEYWVFYYAKPGYRLTWYTPDFPTNVPSKPDTHECPTLTPSSPTAVIKPAASLKVKHKAHKLKRCSTTELRASR